MSIDIPYFEDPSSALKPGVPITERDTINAIVYDPRADAVLCLDWQAFGWKTFVIGGIEGSEDPSTAARREITEETGYAHLRFVADLGKIRSGYYAAHKSENRIANTTGLLFELIDERKSGLPAENLPHTFVWVPRAEVAAFITLSSQQYLWEKAQHHLPKA